MIIPSQALSSVLAVVLSEEATFSWGAVSVVAALAGFLAEARHQIAELRKDKAARDVEFKAFQTFKDSAEKDIHALSEWRREAKTWLETLRASDASMDGRLIRVETTVGAIHDTVLKIDARLSTMAMSGTNIRQTA